MRTATITFHASHNYGSMLQAYALQQIIQQLGHDNEIINLRTEQQKRLYGRIRGPLWKEVLKMVLFPKLYLGAMRKYELFERFLAEELRLTKEYASLEELRQAELKYDCFISGGDQIWNTTPFDFDWSFYLPFTAKKKISYGVSMGPSSESSVTYRERIKSYLLAYSHIAVREEGTRRIVEQLTGKVIDITLDPVLLFSKEEWYQRYPQEPMIKGDYIFVYTPGSFAAVYPYAERLGDWFDMPVIASMPIFRNKYKHVRNCLAVGPWEFLNLLQHTKLVVSGSYHAVIFSILFHKPFFAIAGDKDNRMRTALENNGLMERTLSWSDFEEKRSQSFQCDFTQADEYLVKAREVSMNYLRNAIEN